MDAKNYEKLRVSLKPFDRDKQHEPEIADAICKDAIADIVDRVKKYGTSQDSSEWKNDPVYSKTETYKDFAVMICFYDEKYQARAITIDGKYKLSSDWMGSAHEAGKYIHHIINAIRKNKREDILKIKLDNANEQKKFRQKIMLRN